MSSGGPPGWVDGIIAAVAAVAGAIGKTLLGRRSQSGTVETSTAEMLWAEGARIRAGLESDLERSLARERAQAEVARDLQEQVFKLRRQLVLAEAELEYIHRRRIELGGEPDDGGPVVL